MEVYQRIGVRTNNLLLGAEIENIISIKRGFLMVLCPFVYIFCSPELKLLTDGLRVGFCLTKPWQIEDGCVQVF